VVLETSLKPFKTIEPEAIRATCRRLFTNWERLLERCGEICVLLWVGDGSEIYEWHGDWDEELVWAKSIGFCNLDVPDVYPEQNRHYVVNKAVPYIDGPPVIRFRHLRSIIGELRSAARELLGRPILVGATVDPGPEFVESKFKYERHREVIAPRVRERIPWMVQFLTHQCSLRADPAPYAGFPDGIPEGTPFGTFLGKQFAAAARDIGFDYIWFSNGFGYTHFPWGYRGEVFDGQSFDAERAGVEREKANQFWRDFRSECPDVPIEVRGTNFSIGMDLATDGCSHADIMAIGRLERPPCNPPWGSRALGLEMASYLSRIAKSATRRLPFRFYLNDPWFTANPWYDYYNRETFDIYVPMSAARLNDEGGVDTPTDLSFLTIDTEKGELLRDEANEVIPHVLRALDERADAPGPLIWVYPFDQYDEVLKSAPDRLGHLFFHDWFVSQCVTAGLPLNTVCDADRFVSLADADSLPDAVYFAPVPVGKWAYERRVLDWVRAGGRVLLYGSLEYASPALLEALGLTLQSEALDGDFEVELKLIPDRFAVEAASVGAPSAADRQRPESASQRPLRHRSLVSGGGLRALCDWGDPGLRVVASQGEERRAYAVSRARPEWNGGQLAWIRGSVTIEPSVNPLGPTFDPPSQVQQPAEWVRRMLADLGIDVVQERHDAGVRAANVFIKRFRGGWYFVGHKPNTTVRFWVRTADGAPLYAESETPIVGGYAGESFGKSFYSEVRAFVQMRDGIVQTKELPSPVGRERRVSFANLVDACVTVYPEPASLDSGHFELHAAITRDQPVPYELDRRRGAAVVKNFTGTLYAAW